MDETAITFSLELRLQGRSLAGSLVEAGGKLREFLGLLGLLAAIDALVEDSHPTAPTGADDGRRTP